MATPLVQTKLYIPPSRPELVPRPHLIERLNKGLRQRGFEQSDGFGRKLTLVTAPAGYGKTTLVSNWLLEIRDSVPPGNWKLDDARSTQSPPILWFSIDPEDNTLETFFAYLAAATKKLVGAGESLTTCLQSPQSIPPRACVAAWLNDVVLIAAPFILVLDDFHLITSSEIHQALAYLLDRMPPHIHLVIISRADPLLPLARLRVRGEVQEIREQDLRFTAREMATFFNELHNLDISADSIATLETHTEGWVASLQLAALSMRNLMTSEAVASFIHAFTGSHRYMMDYLLEEVLHQQPETTQEFLLKTSMLKRFNAALCNVVTGRTDSQAVLERLYRGGILLIPLDEAGLWYRYHSLFGEFLQHQLRQRYFDQLTSLYRRASDWHLEQQQDLAAIDYSLTGQDFAYALQLISQVMASGRLGPIYRPEMERWLQILPAELIATHPHLSLKMAWVMFHQGKRDQIETHLQKAEAAVLKHEERLGEGTIQQQRLIQGEVATMRALLARLAGNVTESMSQSEKALANLPEGEGPRRAAAMYNLAVTQYWQTDVTVAEQTFFTTRQIAERANDFYLYHAAIRGIGACYYRRGRLQAARQLYWQSLEQKKGEAYLGHWGLFFIHIGLAEILFEQNDLAAAQTHLDTSRELCDHYADPLGLCDTCIALARLKQAQGDTSETDALLQKADAILLQARIQYTSVVSPWPWYRMQIWLSRGRDGLAEMDRRLAQMAQATTGTMPQHLHDIYHLGRASYLIATDQFDDALALIKTHRSALEARGGASKDEAYMQMQLWLLSARCLDALRNREQAIQATSKALELAETHSYTRAFIEWGEPLKQLLHQAAARGQHLATIRRLLDAFGDTQPLAGSMVETLSRREQEVLRLIAAGLSNPEIAETLTISINTVKKHITNIYGKLGVTNRVEAVTTAQELHLL
jgi:LuxR family maltose regulon positive regulatory protein